MALGVQPRIGLAEAQMRLSELATNCDLVNVAYPITCRKTPKVALVPVWVLERFLQLPEDQQQPLEQS